MEIIFHYAKHIFNFLPLCKTVTKELAALHGGTVPSGAESERDVKYRAECVTNVMAVQSALDTMFINDQVRLLIFLMS